MVGLVLRPWNAADRSAAGSSHRLSALVEKLFLFVYVGNAGLATLRILIRSRQEPPFKCANGKHSFECPLQLHSLCGNLAYL